MREDTNRNDLQEIITQAIEEIKNEQGDNFDLQKINLAELSRRTNISRSKLRRLKKNGFEVKPYASTGRKARETVLSGYTGVIDDLLRHGVTNSEVCYSRIYELGYAGGKTTIKNYIKKHRYLVPAPRQMVAPQGNRGRRYSTGPGESFQMDWGFVHVETDSGSVFYTYDDNGKVETEMYFDDDKQPVRSVYNRYGARHEYTEDGKESVVQNLDADGNLMTNTNSYVTVNKTYTDDGKLHTIMYYDFL